MLTEMFCLIDDFCKSMEQSAEGRKLLGGDSDFVRRRENLSLSERNTIIVLFHRMGWRNFKNFYNHYVCPYLQKDFPRLPSYARFVALMPRTLLPLIVLMDKLRGKSRGPWHGWHRHITLAMIAHAFLTVQRAILLGEKKNR